MLANLPSSFLLNLFADTAYQLFVNGAFVQFGPVRFDIRKPQFDAVDIASRLKPGRNVVAVLVKSFGCKTFKDNSVRGGFISWGKLDDGRGESVDFSTGEQSDWRVRKCEALDPSALKMSFALDAIDVFDQSKELSGWKEIDFDDGEWGPAVELEKQDGWGELQPRSIPFMELKEVPYAISRPVDPLSDSECVFGFSVAGSRFHGADKIFEGRNKMAVGVATWIHSPRRQTVVVGLFWGTYFLNGKECKTALDVDGLRKNFRLELEEGWNSFFAIEQFMDDCLSYLMAVPRSAGLSLSPRKALDDEWRFVRTEVVAPDLLSALVAKGAPEPCDGSFEDIGGWIDVGIYEMDSNPARRSMWDVYSHSFEEVQASELETTVFALSDYPNGFSLFLEFETMHLVLPRMTVGGAAGATIDLAYSEHLSEDKSHLNHTIVYQGGDRILVSEDFVEFMPSQPRGARYLRITVRGAVQDVCFETLRFLSCRYPVQKLGQFECSDALLNNIWAMCERTQHANMEDVFVDCSGRERGMYLRDTIIQFHNTLAAYGDTRLMGRCMELFGQSPDATGKFRAVFPNKGDYTISDFAIEAIDGYWQYYLNTGDIERLRADWPAMLRSIDWFDELSDERKDGFLDADWPVLRETNAHYGGLHGDNGVPEELMDKTGPNACLTFPYLWMLASAGKIAKELGESQQAEEFESRHSRICAKARELLWNPKKGCYNDNLSGGTQSLHASILAVLSGVATPVQIDCIRLRFRTEFRQVFLNGYSPKEGACFSPAYSFFIFQGLYELGLPGLAESLMREGWGWMLANGAVTTHEFFNLTASHCHAWSACPMYHLSKQALGVKFPNAPDLSVVEIDVQSELDWAKGAFPIPGTSEVVAVEWQRNSEGLIEAFVRAPVGISLRWDKSRIQVQFERNESSKPSLVEARKAV